MIGSVTGTFLNWVDEKLDYEFEDSNFKSYTKAICNGFLKGAVDGLVINGLILTGLGLCTIIVNATKKD